MAGMTASKTALTDPDKSVFTSTRQAIGFRFIIAFFLFEVLR
jgi:hypothetical protein